MAKKKEINFVNNKIIQDKLLEFSVINSIKSPKFANSLATVLGIFIVSLIILLFLVPWVQNTQGIGTVISVSPDKRVQNVSALVSGRVKKWYVNEGSKVKKGDKIVEIIDNDSNLIERLQSDEENAKINLEAIKIAKENTLKDYERQKDLNKIGLSSQKNVEQAKIKYKGYVSKLAEANNSLNEAQKKLSRQQRQIIYAPSDGTILRIIYADEATSVNPGEVLASFVPDNIDFAVEIFIKGVDAPLVYEGRKVRLQFEGWPIVQFSGWPSQAIGTFGGVVQSVDPTVSANGKFRVIIFPDKQDKPWPSQRYLRYGAKVQGWILLDEVSIGYEIWRKVNNFPPEMNNNERQGRNL